MKACPVQAIRMRSGKAHLLEDKCIDCGECVKVCKTGAVVPLTDTFNDFSRFKYTVAIPSLALYSQFERNVMPKKILEALKRIGFDDVFDSTKTCITIFRAIEKYIKNYTGRKPLISSFCPTCIKLIQIRYPELLGNIIPVVSPMELAAKEVKQEICSKLGYRKNEVGIIYITPCPSKMTLIAHKLGKFYSDFDGSIPISDIYNSLYAYINQSAKTSGNSIDYYDISGFGLHLAKVGGLTSLLESENSISVSGINNVLFILEDIERGKLNDIDLVEMNACLEGCLGGSLVVENLYMAWNKMNYLIKQYGEKKIPVRKKNAYNESDLFYKSIYEPLPPKPIDSDLKTAISKITERKEIHSKLPDIDCGACGAPSCMSFAEDVVLGDAKLNDCVFMFNNDLKNKLKEKMMQILELQRRVEER
jgi:iron only hydrogenase large subunit-like protein